MIDLDLLGVGADEETLVFTDSEGRRYTTPITDELRGAVRRDRPRIEAVSEDKPLRTFTRAFQSHRITPGLSGHGRFGCRSSCCPRR